MKSKYISVFITLTLLFASASLCAQHKDLSAPLATSSSIFSWDYWWPAPNPPEKTAEEKIENPFQLDRILSLEQSLKENIFGQDLAIRKTVASLKKYALGIHEPNAPIATMLYLGPSGVGKTYLSEQLALALFGNTEHLIRFNMADYPDYDDKNRIFGDPKMHSTTASGLLTKALQKHPYGIVLLEDVDLAHTWVLKPLHQAFDLGFYDDGNGHWVDCRNFVFILTSSLEEAKIRTMSSIGYSEKKILKSIEPTLSNVLTTQLFNRLDPVLFIGIRQEVLPSIVKEALKNYSQALKKQKNITLDYDETTVDFIIQHIKDLSEGIRPIKQFIKETISDTVAEALSENFIKKNDTIFLIPEGDCIVIQNAETLETFSWKWKEEEGEVKPLFHLNQLLTLEDKLNRKILGQPHAVQTTVAALIRYTAGIRSSKAPIASLLYIGPTGVGKTQLAKELARELLGSENNLIRLDMSEYSESHSISRLIGSPPGYVDHDEGGQLTEALKKQPYAVVLLDEIEKADPVVMKTFLQVFDEGHLSDAQGTTVDCSNAIFIMTTNLGAQKILTMDEIGVDYHQLLESLQPEIISRLSPELFNRMDPVIFRGLSKDLIDQMVLNSLKEVQDEVKAKRKIEVIFDPSVREFIKKYGFDPALGARPLKRIIQQKIVTPISTAIVEGKVPSDHAHIEQISVSNEGDYLLIHHQDEEVFRWKCKEDKGDLKPPFNMSQLLELEDRLNQRILGQPEAIETTVASLIRYSAGIRTSTAPIASLLYIGPTGVGKTQLAKEIARELLGSESNLIRLDMSEYTEPYAITRLIGSPPGYVDSNEGGQLTEALKKHPCSVVLLDEIEKAHPSIMKTFLQVFDEGRLTDARGTTLDCSNAIFIMTTNLGAQIILAMDEIGSPYNEILETIQPELTSYLSPELFNRMDPVIFRGLSSDLIHQLVLNTLGDVQKELQLKKNIEVIFEQSVIKFLIANGFDYTLGARPLKRMIQQKIVTPIARTIVQGRIQSGDTISIESFDGELVISKH